MPVNGVVRLGQRVWVARENGRRTYGQVATLCEQFLGSAGFVVLLDGNQAAVTCTEDRRGTQWDFADGVKS